MFSIFFLFLLLFLSPFLYEYLKTEYSWHNKTGTPQYTTTYMKWRQDVFGPDFVYIIKRKTSTARSLNLITVIGLYSNDRVK